MEYLQVGYIIDSFGLDGTLKIKSSSTKASLRYKNGNQLFLVNPNNENDKTLLTVCSFRSSQGIDFVKFDEITTKEEALSKKGYSIQVVKNNNDLDDGEYFYSDLEKCIVCNQDDIEIGKIIKVEEFPAQITLRCIDKNNKQFFVPFINEFIISVDINNKIVKINVIKGMI